MKAIIRMTSLFGLLVLKTVLFKGCQCQDLIGPSPPMQVALMGQTHTLTCSKASTVSNDLTWFDDTLQLYFGTLKGSDDAKYDNFGVVSESAEQLDLQITNIAVEDEGTYICQIFSSPGQQQAVLTVEVRSSSLDMTQGGSGTTLITVTEGEPSEIKCTAVGARPAVTIDWYHTKVGGSETKITDGVNQVNTPNADNAETFDSVSTLNYTASKDYNGGSLRCVTSGQEVAENRQDTTSLNVQYHPEITSVNYANEVIICNAEANPEVTNYAIIVNPEVFYPPGCFGSECRFSFIVTEADTNIRCNATNTLGMDSDFAIVQPGGGGQTNTAAIVLGVLLGISIIIIVILLLYILLIQNQNSTTKDAPQKTRSSSEHPANVPQSNMELDPQTRQHESTNQQPSAKNPDPSQAYMDLNPQTRDDKTAYQELDKNAKAKQGSGTRVYEEIKDAKTTKQQDKEPQTYANVQPNKPRQAKRK